MKLFHISISIKKIISDNVACAPQIKQNKRVCCLFQRSVINKQIIKGTEHLILRVDAIERTKLMLDFLLCMKK